MQLDLDTDHRRLTLRGDDERVKWSIDIDGAVLSRATFHEARLWQPGSVACVGVGEQVWLFDLDSGMPRLHLDLNQLHPSGFSRFGHFGEASLSDGTELLFVLSYIDVIAIDASLSIRWIARDVAIDGITGADGAEQGDLLVVHAEMDPPGGWFEVTLDARTGRELKRIPAFTSEYVGIYGCGSPNE